MEIRAMKPCSHYREAIGALALGALPEAQGIDLQNHLARCPACRRHADELSRVCDDLNEMAGALSRSVGPEVDPSFHRQVMKRVRTQPSRAAPAIQSIRRWLWPLSAAAVGVLLFLFNRSETTPPTDHRTSQAAGQRTAAGDAASWVASPSPTYSRYRAAANGSLDELETLLTASLTRGYSNVQPLRAGDFHLAGP